VLKDLPLEERARERKKRIKKKFLFKNDVFFFSKSIRKKIDFSWSEREREFN
jgi:hypothetical protein